MGRDFKDKITCLQRKQIVSKVQQAALVAPLLLSTKLLSIKTSGVMGHPQPAPMTISLKKHGRLCFFSHKHTFSKNGEMQDLKIFEHVVIVCLIPRQFEENYYLYSLVYCL